MPYTASNNKSRKCYKKKTMKTSQNYLKIDQGKLTYYLVH